MASNEATISTTATPVAAAAAASTSPTSLATTLLMPATQTQTQSIATALLPSTASKKDGTREVEQSLEVLDRVLSEYDERDTPLSSLEHTGLGCISSDGISVGDSGVGSASSGPDDAGGKHISSGSNSSSKSTKSSSDSVDTSGDADAGDVGGGGGGGCTANAFASDNANDAFTATAALNAAAPTTVRTSASSALQSAPRQSEDDGYVSMNGRRCFSGTNTADYRSRSEGDAAAGVAVADGTGKITTLTPMTTTPPPPLSKHIVLPSAVSDVTASVVGATQQVTLPKKRTTEMISRFASLPSSTVGRDDADGQPPRAILGIGISAVHSAVLSGVARIPETIVNEHPVTIYPGRCSPTKRNSTSSNSASPRNPSSGGPASPRSTTFTSGGGGYEPNDNISHYFSNAVSATAASVAAAATKIDIIDGGGGGNVRSPSSTQQRGGIHTATSGADPSDQKLSKLFASAMRTSSDEVSSCSSPHNELITLKSVFSNAARMNSTNNNGIGRNCATASAAAGHTYIGLVHDDEVDGGGAVGEEFSDDSLEEELATVDQSSMTSSVASLPPPVAASVGVVRSPEHPMTNRQQQSSYHGAAHRGHHHYQQQRQVVDVHAAQNGSEDIDDDDDDDEDEDDDDIDYENNHDGNNVHVVADDKVEDNGPWVLRDDVALAAQNSFGGRKTNLIEPLDYNSFKSVNNTRHPNHHHHHQQQQHQLQHRPHQQHNDRIESYAASTDNDDDDDDDEWPQPPPASIDDDDHNDNDNVDGIEKLKTGGPSTFNHHRRQRHNIGDYDNYDNNYAEYDDSQTDDGHSSYVEGIGTNVKLNDTYVIRKGCKQRISVQAHDQYSPIKTSCSATTSAAAATQEGITTATVSAAAAPTASPASANAPTKSVVVVAAEQLCTTNAKFVSSIRVPFTRHSIDLGGGGGAAYGGGAGAGSNNAGQQAVATVPTGLYLPDSKHSARTRLSLDLGSPNKALPPPPPPMSPPTAASTTVAHPKTSAPPLVSPTSSPYAHNNNNNAKAVLSPRYSEFKKYKSTFDAFYALDVTNSNHHHQYTQQGQNNNATGGNCCTDELRDDDDGDNDELTDYRHSHNPHQPSQYHQQQQQQQHLNSDGTVALMRVSSLPSIAPAISGEKISTTPRRELVPPLEEDEEQDSERDVPLRQIENNISALLRGDIAVARGATGINNAGRRTSIGLRSGVHKSESAKEMLLSQNMFGPLPPSPPATMSSPEEGYGFPPLPPLPPSPPDAHHQPMRTQSTAAVAAYTEIGPPTPYSTSSIGCRSHPGKASTSSSASSATRRESATGGCERPPSIPPHRGPSNTTLKTRSMDAGISRSHRAASVSSHQLMSASPQCPTKSNSYDKHRSPALPSAPPVCGSTNTRRRMMPNGFPKRLVQSPREEQRLQTSLSLPETPIFARGDAPRTPHRRTQPEQYVTGGSRTAPRQQTASCMNSSIMGVGNTLDSRPRLPGHQAFAGGEMLRLAGGPARGWYPRQRHQQQHQQQQQQHHHHHQRPLSTENLEGLSTHSRTARFWDGETPGGGRKPLTLPPNMSPKFFNKSPRDALRRVTSMLIRKGGSDSKKDRDASIKRNVQHAHQDEVSTLIAQPKKKGFFKSFWKKSKHISMDK